MLYRPKHMIRVNGKKLFEVLKDKNVSGEVRRVFTNVYKETKIRVRIENKLSNYATISRGVRQGRLLSCVLFNMYMDHMKRELQKTDPKGIKWVTQHEINTILFADD